MAGPPLGLRTSSMPPVCRSTSSGGSSPGTGISSGTPETPGTDNTGLVLGGFFLRTGSVRSPPEGYLTVRGSPVVVVWTEQEPGSTGRRGYVSTEGPRRTSVLIVTRPSRESWDGTG